DPRQQTQQGGILALLPRVEARAERLAQKRRGDRVRQRELGVDLAARRGGVDALRPKRRHPHLRDLVRPETLLLHELPRRRVGGMIDPDRGGDLDLGLAGEPLLAETGDQPLEVAPVRTMLDPEAVLPVEDAVASLKALLRGECGGDSGEAVPAPAK